MDKARARLAGTSKLSAFFEDDNDEPSVPPTASVTEAKLSSFQAGKITKSKREKEKEAAEAKKREEEDANAKALAEYMETFDGVDSGRRRHGGRGSGGGGGFVRSSAESSASYAPSSSFSNFGSRSAEPPRGPRLRAPSPPSQSAPKPKGKRAMDSFLEEIKRDQADREARYGRQAQGQGKSVSSLAALQGQSGSRDRGDPLTSNVFVANLPNNVTEQSLGQFFSRVGSIGSVKIMWPRSDSNAGPGADMTSSRKQKHAGLSGFVSFMRRKDAEEALREFDGYEWLGSVLRVGWSKAVPIAQKAMYPSTKRHSSRSRSRSRSPKHRGGYPSLSRSRSPRRRRSRSPVRDRRRTPSPSPRRRRSRSPRLEEDADTVTDTFIRAVVSEVMSHDLGFEDKLREREKENPKYHFLTRKSHHRHAYYRGLMESKHRSEPEFDDEGYNSVYSTDSAEDSEREHTRKTALGRLARRRFEAMLRALSGKRGEMARCMAFCLDHAEAAPEVVDIIVSSLLVEATAVPRKVARLHLICDILHNSAAPVPSAWRFRQEFQSRLGIVFDHLSGIYHSFPGRITAETFKKQITSVLEIWEDWIVFPPDFTSELRSRLDGDAAPNAGDDTAEDVEGLAELQSATGGGEDRVGALPTSKFKTGGFKLAAEPVPESSVADEMDGEPMDTMDALDGAPMDSDNIDGAPIDDNLDGVPMDDVDGVPLDEIDGEPLNATKDRTMGEEDLDGQPVDDVDGAPI